MLINKELGRYLKRKRLKMGLSQKAVADHLGYTAQFIHNWEKGKAGPPMKAVREIAILLNIPNKQLINKMIQLYRKYLKQVLIKN